MPQWETKKTPTIRAGRLRQKIDIVVTATPQDSTGGFDIFSDYVYANVWASVEALTASEKFAAHEFVSQCTHQVIIRWIGPAPSWQPESMYLPGSLISDANLNLQITSVGGLSGMAAPVWNPTPNGYTTDGSSSLAISWRNLGPPIQQTGIVHGMEVWFQGRQFQVEGVLNPDERNKLLILMCIEINDTMQRTPVPSGQGGLFTGTVITERLDGGGF